MIDQNSQFFAILTKVGEAKLSNATALGIPWKLTQMGVGDANGTDPIPDRLQTRLINERRRAPLNQLKPDPVDLSVLIAEQVIPADVGGWWVRELGLYDEDGDLVAVANCAPSYKPVLNQGSGRTQIVRMNFVVSSIANIVLKIDPAIVLATREYVDQSLEAVLPGNKAAGTYRQVTINKHGIVQSGTNPTTLKDSGIEDGVTKTELASAVSGLLSKSGGTMSGYANFSSVGSDTPGVGFKSPRSEAYINLVDNCVRIFAKYGGVDLTPILLNLADKSASVFGNGLWHAGNFDPNTRATKTELSNAVSGLLPKAGGTVTGSITLANGTNDSPEIIWEGSGGKAYMDLVNSTVRIFVSRGGETSTPLALNFESKTAHVFDRQIWDSGNFDPASKADKATTLTSAQVNDALAKKWDLAKYPPENYIKLGQTIPSFSNLKVGSGNSGAIATIPSSTGAFMVGNEGNNAASAVINFHREGSFAAYFGLDTDNQWKVGGWSMGLNSYVLWHAGNFNPADKADVKTSLRIGSVSRQYPVLAPPAPAAGGVVGGGSLQLREAQEVGGSQTDISYAPGILFHWSGRAAKTLCMSSTAELIWGNDVVITTGNLPQSIGVGQTWQSVIGSRASGVTYTNTTGRSIMVAARVDSAPRYMLELIVSGVSVSRATNNDEQFASVGTVSAIVPSGATYSVTVTVTNSISHWAELR